MDSGAQQETQAQASARRARISYACEACRAAKVKCQPSSHQGICKRCSDSKRECIFKTGPRTRRPRRKNTSSTPSTPRPAPVPAGPSKTFTIDIPMKDEFEDLSQNLDDLRSSHEMYVADLFPGGDEEYASYSEYTDDEEDEGVGSSFHHRAGDSIAGASSVASHASSLPVGASALSTPPSSVSQSKLAAAGTQGRRKGGLAALGVRPQFNLDSAEKLLAEFESRMLLHFPAVAPSTVDATVTQLEQAEDGAGGAFSVAVLAKTKPFVLLAILAAASGSRTLQGHSLYDDEFRKILGLKFVAGGERSLELLQGLVIYTAWYPFHLRPKNKQAFQYVRMVVDIVNDLELDQDYLDSGDTPDSLPPQQLSPERLEQIRTYLATYYLVSSFAAAWNRVPALLHTRYTAKCCAVLERDSDRRGDRVLAWLVRVQHILEEVSGLRKTRGADGQNEYQVGLMLKGMDSQLAEWEARMPADVAATPSIRLAFLFAKIFIPAAPLLKLPIPKRRAATSSSTNQVQASEPIFLPSASRLLPAVRLVKSFFELLLSFSASEMNSFSGTEWARFILVVILGFRVSFPLPDCPDWDDGWARREIDFGGYLARFEAMGAPGDEQQHTAGGSSMDVLNASKVVMGVVRKKWEKRAGRMERALRGTTVSTGVAGQTEQQQQQQQQPGVDVDMGLAMDLAPGPELADLAAGMDPALLDKSLRGCPMIDGSLESYYPLWEENFSSSTGMGSIAVDHTGAGAAPMPGDEYVDLWGTMTGGWAQWPQGDGGFDGDSLPP